MKIYRLERKGFGPFNVWAPGPGYREARDVVDSVDWSSKNNDGPSFKRGDSESKFLYGCSSYDKLEKYFTKNILEQLMSCGYEVIEINVPKKACRFASDNGEVEVAFHRYYRDKLFT